MSIADSASETTATRVRAVSALFYGTFGLALLALVTKAHASVFPDGIAGQLGHNSEALALALAVSATLQFARPRWLRPSAGQVAWGLVLAVAAVWLAAAWGVSQLDSMTSVKTLNEPLLAAALLTIYAGPHRPLRRAWLVPLLIVSLVVVAFDSRVVQTQAESVIGLIAIALSLDLFDRRILDRRAGDSPWVWLWYLWLAAWPALMLAANRFDLNGIVGSAVEYQARGAEGFWGALLVCLYFRLLRHRESAHVESASN